MQKILVIGSAGSGKSTLATTLGERLGLPVIHMDALYWQPGWQETPKELWRQQIAELVHRECWIMDGHYGGTLETRVQACDTVILLALPRLLCLYRVYRRAVRYMGRTRADLHPGCPEQWPDWPFLRWIWTFPKQRLPKLLELLRTCEGEKQVVILRSPAEVHRFLATIKPPEKPPQPTDQVV